MRLVYIFGYYFRFAHFSSNKDLNLTEVPILLTSPFLLLEMSALRLILTTKREQMQKSPLFMVEYVNCCPIDKFSVGKFNVIQHRVLGLFFQKVQYK